MNFAEFNFFAVLLAALATFILGGLWYSPLMFKSAWLDGCGLTDVDLAQASMGKVFSLAFILSLVAAFVFALFLGPKPDLGFAVGAGFAAGLCWVATSFGISYLFEQRPLKLFLVNGGYHTLQFTLIGLILGLWH
ncbi:MULTISPECIES: DUF1761 domain-containing protein [unclassified Pseudoalteromonas]|uniref:DUF1761 domain-containing protein n=1 Tax=unclassified Pseudoalteromonas TaxID=194690 RepID=UPI000CF6E35F|nr:MULTISPECIES: DUF1761 domain-containing protein [unclassified Pseudoalteromonas]